MMMKFDGDLSIEEIADMFREHEWPYAVPGCYGIPGGDDIVRQLVRMVHEIEENDWDYLPSGRLALVRDDKVRNTFHVLINVGYLYTGPDEELFE